MTGDLKALPSPRARDPDDAFLPPARAAPAGGGSACTPDVPRHSHTVERWADPQRSALLPQAAGGPQLPRVSVCTVLACPGRRKRDREKWGDGEARAGAASSP